MAYGRGNTTAVGHCALLVVELEVDHGRLDGVRHEAGDGDPGSREILRRREGT